MKLCYLVACLVAISVPPPTATQYNSWSDPSKAQYHIQTDEGPERYFRYQTLSGQYRKEKRLEDGTVVGTYGWVDDIGMLRMRDYIADNAGYRILKSKKVYVGRNVPINEALKIAKKAPAEAGVLVSSNTSPNAKTPPGNYGYRVPAQPVYSTPVQPQFAFHSPASTSSLPLGYGTSVSPFGYNPPLAPLGHTPVVHISPNSGPSSTESPLGIGLSSTVLPSVVSSTPSPIGISSTTPSTIYIPSTTPSSVIAQSTLSGLGSSTSGYVSSTPSYGSSTPSSLYSSSTLPPPIRSNSLDTTGYSGAPQYEHYPEDYKRPYLNPYAFQNGPTYPIDKNGNIYTGSNHIGNGYDPQFPLYDGVAITNDGFRYYLPRQYHEEQNVGGDQKSGSFGYIDPFGIRRVIYYNAAPGTGFQHKKNNRYVGFDATPYDPRPL